MDKVIILALAALLGACSAATVQRDTGYVAGACAAAAPAAPLIAPLPPAGAAVVALGTAGCAGDAALGAAARNPAIAAQMDKLHNDAQRLIGKTMY